MSKFYKLILLIIVFVYYGVSGQSISFETYLNPVIPGDHPDPTLTKIGNDFYTSGSSFNPTPKIYHSTDLVHWEVIAQPVSASWSGYGDSPGGGIWGGHMVYHNGIYWHFFGKGGGSMYFATAEQPEGPWSDPTQMTVPSGLSGLGVDNSIFIDDNDRWYLLTKHGRENNHIVELGNNGQPNGNVLDLTWLNPAPDYPYSWAEGPVMWKYNGYYYYSFAQHLAGSQYVMRSSELTDDESAWTVIGTNIFRGTINNYTTPNHISPAVTLDDGTSWVIAHSYNRDWQAHGRQGLMCQVTYNEDGFPEIARPSDDAQQAPELPSSGIPWMVPHSDFFNSDKLNPEWSFLGYTPAGSYSLVERSGWLKLAPFNRLGENTVIKNDGEHNYSLITRVDFDPESSNDEAGLRVINGPENLEVKLISTMNSDGDDVFSFSFDNTEYETENTIGAVVWLKLIRQLHRFTGFYSADGIDWTEIGEYINAKAIDEEQTQFNDFTGNQQGLYIKNKEAYFDLYIYRDAYTPIWAAIPANQFGVKVFENRYPPNSLGQIDDGDWALLAGVEFGNDNYPKMPDSVIVTASSETSGGVVELWMDSLDSGTRIAECEIGNTGDWNDYLNFKAPLLVDSISGNHDLYLKFKGNGSDEPYRLMLIKFSFKERISTSINQSGGEDYPDKFTLEQNFPNPFNPTTNISYSISKSGHVSISVFDLLGREVANIVNERQESGYHTVQFEADKFTSGIYIYQLESDTYSMSRKMILLK